MNTKQPHSTNSLSFDAGAVQKHILVRNFAIAEKICQEAIADNSLPNPILATAHHLLGTCYYLQNNLPKSVEEFKNALTLDPKNTDAAISLSVIYNDVGKYEDAKKIYEVANRSLALKRQGADQMLDRKFSLKHIEIGDLYFKFHRYEDALNEYAKAIRLDPAELSTRIKLAKVNAKKGFTSRAIQELQQLCHEHPDYVASRIQLGLMYFSQGNVIDAESEWQKAKMRDPLNDEIQTYLEMAKRTTETIVN